MVSKLGTVFLSIQSQKDTEDVLSQKERKPTGSVHQEPAFVILVGGFRSPLDQLLIFPIIYSHNNYIMSSSAISMVLQHQCASEWSRELVKTQIAGPHPRISNSAVPAWGTRVPISINFQDKGCCWAGDILREPVTYPNTQLLGEKKNFKAAFFKKKNSDSSRAFQIKFNAHSLGSF